MNDAQLLEQLVSKLGGLRAAEELGVSRRQLYRLQSSGRMTQTQRRLARLLLEHIELPQGDACHA
ncbi:transcriptional regulator, putative [Nitratidesulfovibrio vulgaris str. Hildenborough]|uniref:Transcriptional regulator, putative n=1 Tax=Nitratidesulfovibrio vulgaris (strain ATCC 29579 / DSM 644 / CCUG 34227 / NCIMB 8303 / VKM B-1760 / Hildenborough) TaxID=882 RepID=Q72A07_NITV2|nr:transcriptional regulator, putative [Nitratidesulfovibrio vulgaris str. Hildenborough]